MLRGLPRGDRVELGTAADEGGKTTLAWAAPAMGTGGRAMATEGRAMAPERQPMESGQWSADRSIAGIPQSLAARVGGQAGKNSAVGARASNIKMRASRAARKHLPWGPQGRWNPARPRTTGRYRSANTHRRSPKRHRPGPFVASETPSRAPVPNPRPGLEQPALGRGRRLRGDHRYASR